MPLPLLAVAAIVGILVSAGAAAAVALWPAAKGKSLLLMGPVCSGKTTLGSFLTDGTIPRERFQTAGMHKNVPTEDIKLRDLKLKIDAIFDAPGDREAIGAWHEKAKHVDVLLYLVNLAEASNEEYVVRVRRDTRQLGEWRRLKELRDDSRTILVVTHLDQQDEFRGGGDSAPAAQAERVARAAPAVREAREQLGPSHRFLAGSLIDDASCADLAYRLLGAIQDADA